MHHERTPKTVRSFSRVRSCIERASQKEEQSFVASWLL